MVLFALLWFPEGIREKPGPHEPGIELRLGIDIPLAGCFSWTRNLRATASQGGSQRIIRRARKIAVIVEQILCDLGLFCATVLTILGKINGDENKNVGSLFHDARCWMAGSESSKLIDGPNKGSYQGREPVRSSARFNVRTFTRGSPKSSRSRDSVCCWIRSRTCSSLKPRVLATRAAWTSALRALM